MKNSSIKFCRVNWLIITLLLFNNLLSFNLFSQKEYVALNRLKIDITKKLPKNNYINKLNNLSENYWCLNLDTSKVYTKSALQGTKDNNYPSGKAKVLKNIGVVSHHSIDKKYEDTIFMENNARAEIKIKYESEQKDKETIKTNELIIQKQKNTRNILIATTIIFALIALFLFYKYNSKRQLARMLTIKNKAITKQKRNLDIANQTKSKLFSVISHELINPFNAIIGYTNLLASDYDHFSETQRQEIIATINKSSTVTYHLVKNLLDWARTQQNSITVDKKNYNVKDLVEHAIAPFMFYAKNKENTINFNLEVTEIETDSTLLKTIIANLFMNAVKFSYATKQIIISSFIDENKRNVISIKDFGVGMSEELIQNLSNKNVLTQSVRGTDKEKGTGLGLMVCYEFIELLDGKLEINSAVGISTTINLVF